MTELPYKKIVHILKYRILSGTYLPRQKLSSVRTMAKEMGYNPATVHRAFFCLQQQGLICSQKTAGYFITADVEKIEELRIREIEMLTNNLHHSLCALGYSDLEIYKLIQVEYLKHNRRNPK